MASNRNRKILLQVLKSWNHEGITLQVGARVSMTAIAARAPIKLGYARIVNAEEAYEYPAEKEEHKFQQVSIAGEEETCCDEEPVKEEVKALSDFPAELNLSDYQISNLAKAGYYTLQDIKGKTIDELTKIKGVGKATAQKLIDAYNLSFNVDYHKDSGMDIYES